MAKTSKSASRVSRDRRRKLTKKVVSEAAAALGRLGGLAKSAAKTKAVRENAKLGGRKLGSKNKPKKPKR